MQESLSKIKSKKRLEVVTRYSVQRSGTSYLSQPTKPVKLLSGKDYLPGV